MIICRTVEETRKALEEVRQSSSTIGFVPTMGNIHEGHLTLVDMAREHSDFVVVSIFVNPTQFDRIDDFNCYPRTLEEDSRKLSARGVDLVFAPTELTMYPFGEKPQIFVDVPNMDRILEGAHRPGHFRGVATVVSKLFHIVQPTSAVFGSKDYQQVAVIRAMVRDMHIPVEIIAADTQRETDGLAMSSRNSALTSTERALAPLLYKALSSVEQSLQEGAKTFNQLSRENIAHLNQNGFDVEYFEILNEHLGCPTDRDEKLVILVAAFLGNTRLIDNLIVRLLLR